MRVTKQQAKDILITAVEGGINYWAIVHTYLPESGMVSISSLDDPENVVGITVEKIQQAVMDLFEKKAVASWILEMFVDDDVDAEAADCAIQMAMFGEVVYG